MDCCNALDWGLAAFAYLCGFATPLAIVLVWAWRHPGFPLDATPLSAEGLEKLAAFQHQQWSGWARWMLDHWDDEHIARWRSQIAARYDDLSEAEKESDRTEARRVLAVLKEVR